MIKVIFILIIIIVIILFNKNENFTNELTDLDKKYLEELIKNHQILIDLAELKMSKTNNPDMKYMLKRLILSLDMEIYQINVALNLLFNVNLIDNVSLKNEETVEKSWHIYINNLEKYYKNYKINNINLQNLIYDKDEFKIIDTLIEILNHSNNLSKNIMENNNINDFILDRANKTLYFNNKTIFLLNNMKNNKVKNSMNI
jgi:hypothetical protein